MKRVCVLTTSYPRNPSDDAGIFVQRLVEAYSAAGVSGVVVVPQDGDEPTTESCRSFSVHRYRYGIFGRGRLAFGAGALPNLRARPMLIFQAPMLVLGMVWRAVWLRRSFEVMHANWSVAALAAWIVHLITRVPYVISIRGEDLRFSRPWPLRLLLTLPYRQATHVISVNESFVPEIRERYSLSDERVMSIPNGVDIEMPSSQSLAEFCESRGFSLAKKYLLCVGTVIPRKRITQLVDLLADPELEKFSLIVCGRRDDEQYVAEVLNYAEKRSVAGRLQLVGKVSPADVPYFLALARCFVSASEFEGRPNALLEACAARVPVCVSNIDAHRELLSTESGFLFDAQSLSEAARFISLVTADSKFRTQVTDAAHRLCRELTWARCAERYLEIL